MLLAGDIGGTKTSLALFSSRDELHHPLREKTFRCAHYSGIEAIVREFLTGVDAPVSRAVFGVAGPVINGRVKTTNLPWELDERALQNELGIGRVTLLNDLVSIAHALPLLEPSDLHTLNEGETSSQATMAVVAPGTGLGEAFLTWHGSQYSVHPSEGGHTDFAPTNEREIALLHYLLGRYNHVSYEHVCSGIGLPNIYAYLKQSGDFEEPAWLQAQLTGARDHTPVIVQAALQLADPPAICVETLTLFVSILGAEAGNMALKVLATGGVYLGGGMPPRLLPLLKKEHFMHAFQNKGRFKSLLARVPVHVILNPAAALMGAASYGFTS
ncbi:MAG: glucokinase [Ktedonobacteraceae bacterium]|nr:glucokinase [Ktedonobacteraceae bacterium]